MLAGGLEERGEVVTSPYLDDNDVTLHHGDCLEVMRDWIREGAPRVDAVVTDPPYGFEFMGKRWDRGVPGEPFWKAALHVTKPGGHLLAFGGTRTHHRLACAIEDAGWEIRDCLSWLYGSGFPKSLDISKAIDKAAGAERDSVSITAPATDAARTWGGYGTALKPAWEPIIVAMRPLDGTFAANAQTHGAAGLNVDGCRIGTDDNLDGGGYDPAGRSRKHAQAATSYYTPPARREFVQPSGRWPANVALDAEAAAMLDAQAGERPSGSRAAGVRSGMGYHGADGDGGPAIEASRGGPSRFFYTAKASPSERGDGNNHPTVKPLALMRWLVRLVSPPGGGEILDPFLGSGTTAVACREESQRCVGIEQNEDYLAIAVRRLKQLSLLGDAT